jgi:hypothetical protein
MPRTSACRLQPFLELDRLAAPVSVLHEDAVLGSTLPSCAGSNNDLCAAAAARRASFTLVLCFFVCFVVDE